MREDKVTVYASVQVHMREVAGLEQFQRLNATKRYSLSVNSM